MALSWSAFTCPQLNSRLFRKFGDFDSSLGSERSQAKGGRWWSPCLAKMCPKRSEAQDQSASLEEEKAFCVILWGCMKWNTARLFTDFFAHPDFSWISQRFSPDNPFSLGFDLLGGLRNANAERRIF